MQYSFSNIFERKESKSNWFSPVLIAVLVYLFLVVFQPFGTYNYQHSFKYILLIPYSIIAFTVFFTNSVLKNKGNKTWSWKAQIMNIIYLLIICSILNYFYNLYFINHSSFSFTTLGFMMIFTFFLGLPICTIDLLIQHSLFHSSSSKENIQNSSKALKKVNPLTELCIRAENNQEIIIKHTDFIYVRSEGNYSCIYYLQDNKLEKKLLRISLKQLENQICSSLILRCHRSYIINTKKVKDKKGNARGYQLNIENIDELIPVSRTYLHIIESL